MKQREWRYIVYKPWICYRSLKPRSCFKDILEHMLCVVMLVN